jgi:hypothetical protein
MHTADRHPRPIVRRAALRIPALGAAIAALALTVPACDTESEVTQTTASLPFSIETRAAAPPPEELPRTTLAVALDSGETAELVFTTITPPSDPDAPFAEADDTVTIRFAAGLDLGAKGVRIYDSTEQRNRDFSFSLADPGVIRGLREAIPGMRPGELRRIEIPWRLAYGVNGRGKIPPSTDLVFAVELISID